MIRLDRRSACLPFMVSGDSAPDSLIFNVHSKGKSNVVESEGQYIH